MGMTGGGEHYLAATNTYTYFECPLFSFSIGDSALIVFDAGMTIGNQLFIDSLDFSNDPITVGTSAQNQKEHFDIRKISDNQLLLEYFDGTAGDIHILIHDMLGKECYNSSIINNGNNIAEILNTETLNRGVYFIVIESSKSRLSKNIYIE